MKTVTIPSIYASALINVDYSGLNKNDITTLNNELLKNDVLFSDCIGNSDEYLKLQSGVYCMVMDFYFKGA